MSNPVSPDILRVHERLNNDLEFFCRKALRIKAKSGGIIPFNWNKAQHYLDQRIEDHLRRTGMVRLLILKGRQQGISTYIEGRLYRNTTRRWAKRAFILTHHSTATENLFQMVEKYHESCPDEIKPVLLAANNRRMQFDNESQYTVGTAGTGAIGRSDTNQYLHWCLGEDSLIVLADGSTKPIKNIAVGDIVLTSSGAFAPVEAHTFTGRKQVYTLKTWLTNETIQATAEHKIYTTDGWKQLKDVTTADYVRLPDIKTTETLTCYEAHVPRTINTRRNGGGNQHAERASIPLSAEFGFYLGYYLAEGHVKLQRADDKPCSVSFTYEETENYIQRVSDFAADYATSESVKHVQDAHKKQTTFYGSFLAGVTEQICGRTEDKHIPQWFFDAPKEFLKGALEGYLAGDGSKTEEGHTRAPSVHERIARQLKRIVLAVTSGVPGVHRYERDRYGVQSKPVLVTRICGRAYKDLNGIEYDPGNCRGERFVTKGGARYVRVRDVLEAGIQDTYDIAVGHPDRDFETVVGIVSNSEVAFSENVDGIVTGLLQTVPDAPGTEIFLESTANGEGNFFHTACMQALRGESQYELVFIPWHWQPEYRAATTTEFDLTDEEVELQEMYELDDEQIQWRRNKIASFKAAGYGPQKFKQEYPFTIEEAFQSSGSRLIDGDAVARARKAQITDNNAPLIFGIDPAPLHDRSVICWRQGRQIIKNEVFTGVDSMAMVGKIAKRIDKFEPAKVFIDVGGGGREIASRLCELGYGRIVTAIPFSMKPTDDELYINKRAEMAGEFKQWLEDQVGVRIPDDDVFATEIGAIPEFKTTSTGKSQLVSKEDIIKKFGRSTDLFDAAMLTFAMPVQKDFQNSKITKSSVRRTQSELTTLMARRRNNQSTNSRLTEYDDDERKPGYHRNGPVFKGRR